LTRTTGGIRFSNAHIALTVNSQSEQIACEIYIPDSKILFNELHKNKDKINDEIEEQLIWEELPERKASRIKLVTKGSISNQTDWDQYHRWMLDKVTIFQKVFSKYARQIVAN
jgi:Domain of unknown function (DUF4268)